MVVFVLPLYKLMCGIDYWPVSLDSWLSVDESVFLCSRQQWMSSHKEGRARRASEMKVTIARLKAAMTAAVC